MRRTKSTRRGVVVLTVAAAAGIMSGCASVSQEDYDAGLEGLRSELMQAIEAGDSENAQAINAVQQRVQRVESQLQQFSQNMTMMERDMGVRVERLESSLRFNVPVYFEFDGTELSTRAQEILARFHEVAEQHYPDALITVEGHTDPAGDEAYNMDLGMRRAQAVRTFLVERGMSEDRIRAVSYGESMNRQNVEGAHGPGTEGWENRRVVMVIDHDGQPPAAVTMEETVSVASRMMAPTSR